MPQPIADTQKEPPATDSGLANQLSPDVLVQHERLQVAKEAANLGIYDDDLVSGTFQWDARLREIWGLTADEPVTLETFISGLHPDDRSSTQSLIQKAFNPQGNGKYYAEFRVRNRQDGLERWVAATGRVFFDRENPVRFVGTAQDISEWKRSEHELSRSREELKDTEHRYRQLVQSSPDAIIVHKDGVFLYANAAALRLYGAAGLWQLKERNLIDLIHPGDRKAVMERKRQLELGEKAPPREMRVITLDGREICVEVYSSRVTYGRDKAIQVIVRDITERKHAEEALRQSRMRLIEAQRLARLGDWEWDFSNDEVIWSPGMYDVFRRDPKLPPPDREELARYYSPESWERLKRAISKARETGEPYELELEHIREDGTRYWHLAHGEAVRDGDGHTVRLRGTAQDLTERKQAEEALRESEQRFRLMFEDHGAAMLLIEPVSGQIVDGNYAAIRFYGYSREQLRTMRIEQINQLPPEQCEAERRKAIARSKNKFIFPHRLASSEIRWVEVHSSPVQIQDRLMLFSIIHDITARREAEEALLRLNTELEKRVAERTAELADAAEKVQVERKRLLDVLETLPVILTLLRTDYRVEWANRAYREVLGPSAGRLCYQSRRERQEPCDECQAFIPLKTGLPLRREQTLPNGRIFDIHYFPFEDSDGSPMILQMDLDITESRLAEDQLKQAHEQLEHLTSQLRALAGELTLAEQRERQRIAKVLHDHIQQLLVAAKLQTSLVLRGQRAEDVKTPLQLVSELIDQSISASRNLTAELTPPILYDAGLGPALLWLARNFLEKHGLKVDVNFDPAGEPRVEDVRIFLFDAVREILFNIVKHSGSETAHIECFRGKDACVHVVVSDEGKGFDSSRLRAGDRSQGFGLFSIQQRLKHLGGRLEIESVQQRGTRVILISPPAFDTGEMQPASVQTPQRPAPEVMSERGRIRVVLADDHHIIRQGLAGLLRSEPDIEIVGEASNGAQAVNLARSCRPEVVVMDISMPVMNGVEATAEIRRDMPEIKVVGLSMHEEGELSSAIRQAGAVAYVTKGGSPEALVAAIRKAADLSVHDQEKTASLSV